MSRPSDEMMVEVVKAWQGWESCAPVGSSPNASFVKTNPCEGTAQVLDPRDDTDVALELVWGFEMQLLPIYSISKGPGWLVNNGAGQQWVPPSGSAFRYAVCNLAVEMVKNKAQD